MLKKFTNKKGFTLMEMLIVVAIIAILVAIAIPTFTSSMNKAKAGVDLANIRSGYANAQILAMTETRTANTTYYLQNDGTVKISTETDRDDYTCKASSTDAGAFDKIGGRLTVAWAVGNKITYTVSTSGEVTNIVPPTT